MESINTNEIFRKMNEISDKLNNGCDLAYLEENMQFVLNIGKEYNEDRHSLSQETRNIQIDRYSFLSVYFLTYIAKKYNMHFKYNLFSDFENSCYTPSNNCINLSKKHIGREKFEELILTIFHEFRHRMQCYDMSTNIDTILQIDPATVIFLKEEAVQKDRKLYEGNHDCYYKENDANLFSLAECQKFFKTDVLNELLRRERTNYISAMIQGIDLSDQEYHDKQSLPIVYEEDYRYKKFILGKQIPSNSMLSLIYNPNGTPKTYQELLEEKKKLIEKYKGQVVDRKTSTTNYEQWSNPKRAEEHIEEIFKLIIASDPMLTIQEHLHRWNNMKDEINAKQHIDKIIKLLDDCPQITNIYFNEIKSILLSELRKGNIEIVESIINKNNMFKPAVDLYLQAQAKKRPTGSDEYEERTQEEQQIANGQKKPSKFRTIISETVKKSVILRDEKQKLHEMREQLLDYQEQQSRNQEAEYEEEETHGMSM